MQSDEVRTVVCNARYLIILVDYLARDKSKVLFLQSEVSSSTCYCRTQGRT